MPTLLFAVALHSSYLNYLAARLLHSPSRVSAVTCLCMHTGGTPPHLTSVSHAKLRAIHVWFAEVVRSLKLDNILVYIQLIFGPTKLVYKSAVQNPKHCLTWDFWVALVIRERDLSRSISECGKKCPLVAFEVRPHPPHIASLFRQVESTDAAFLTSARNRTEKGTKAEEAEGDRSEQLTARAGDGPVVARTPRRGGRKKVGPGALFEFCVKFIELTRAELFTFAPYLSCIEFGLTYRKYCLQGFRVNYHEIKLIKYDLHKGRSLLMASVWAFLSFLRFNTMLFCQHRNNLNILKTTNAFVPLCTDVFKSIHFVTHVSLPYLTMS